MHVEDEASMRICSSPDEESQRKPRYSMASTPRAPAGGTTDHEMRTAMKVCFEDCAARFRRSQIVPAVPDSRGNLKSAQRKRAKPSKEKSYGDLLNALALDSMEIDRPAFRSKGMHSNRRLGQLRLDNCCQNKAFSIAAWGVSEPDELPYAAYFPNELWVTRYVTRLVREVLNQLQEDDLSFEEDPMLVPVFPWMLDVCTCNRGKEVRVVWVPDEEHARCCECMKPVKSATMYVSAPAAVQRA